MDYKIKKEVRKVITLGLPMKMVDYGDGIPSLEGFWSYPYLILMSPIKRLLKGSFAFMEYNGSYWSGLKEWLFYR
ncbi:hypothetical protein N9948_01085, partial [bacterium]|nr:hypothetical protein [bacterium]